MIKRFKPGKKKCKAEGCENSFEKNIHQPFQEWCSPECAIKIWNSKKEKKEKKDWAEKKKEMQQNIKKYGDWMKDLEAVINPIARLIDYGQPCISCGGFGKPQAGHFHSVGSNNSLRYNLHNIFGQDFRCNVELSGNLQGYDEGLIKIYGEEYWKYVKFGIKNEYHQPLKLQLYEIKEMISACRILIKELEANKKERTPQERIELRNELNFRIGLYQSNFKI